MLNVHFLAIMMITQKNMKPQFSFKIKYILSYAFCMHHIDLKRHMSSGNQPVEDKDVAMLATGFEGNCLPNTKYESFLMKNMD